MSYTVDPLYNDIHYNSKICYNINLVCTKISVSLFFSKDKKEIQNKQPTTDFIIAVCLIVDRFSLFFSLTLPCYSVGKHMLLIFVRISSMRRF